jgi:hypothetical protein
MSSNDWDRSFAKVNHEMNHRKRGRTRKRNESTILSAKTIHKRDGYSLVVLPFQINHFIVGTIPSRLDRPVDR